jgi:hypothetical protein
LTEAALFTPLLSGFLQAIGAPERYRDTALVRAPQLNG